MTEREALREAAAYSRWRAAFAWSEKERALWVRRAEWNERRLEERR